MPIISQYPIATPAANDELIGSDVSDGSKTRNFLISAVLAIPHAQAWAGITGKPTTIGGYGITDAYTKTEDDARFAPIAVPWLNLTGLPTTIGGYGITDAYTKTEDDARFAPVVHIHANATTGVAGFLSAADKTKLDGIAGGAQPGTVTSVGLSLPSFLTVSGSPITGAGTLAAVLANQAANVVFAGPGSGAAAIPTWRALLAADIPALDWSKLTSGLPTTIAGYGITDVYTKTAADARYRPIGYVPAWSEITGLPTTLAGFGITDAYTKTAADARYAPISVVGSVTSVGLSLPSFLTVSGSPVVGAGTLTAVLATQAANVVFAGPGSGAAAIPTWRALLAADIPALDWSKITSGLPTTIAGYSITDAYTKTESDASYRPIGYVPAWSEITSKPTTIAGYGITDVYTKTAADARYAPIAVVGSVTSVDLSVPGLLYTVTGGPITTAGTLAMALKTQVANTVLAGPASGADATPTMRALLAADIPDLAWSKITSGVPTTLAGYGITDALPLAGGTISGTLGIAISVAVARSLHVGSTSSTGIARFSRSDVAGSALIEIAYTNSGVESVRWSVGLDQGNDAFTILPGGSGAFSAAAVLVKRTTGQVLLRTTTSTAASGLYAPWVSGDTLPAVVIGSSNASNNQDGLLSTSSTGIGVRGVSAGIGVEARTDDSGTANAPSALRVRHVTSGTPAGNFGVGFLMGGTTNGSSYRDIASIVAVWTDATDGSRKGRLTLYPLDTAVREAIRMEADGSAARIGFLGASAVVRQTVSAAATDAATTQTLANSLRTALINLGLAA